ncbi:conserved hypothetical protein [Ricinus communis]|uniref:DC1 domain-containing protein n=1 Tax=Ricinus communis TaxID=3988 RepID=B9S774_RICCO|nr:conserved hypothetical protein [Ricinus communis]
MQHFSHLHPLPFLDCKEEEEYDDKPICIACGKPCWGSDPTYGCKRCNFFLREMCLDIPREIQYFFIAFVAQIAAREAGLTTGDSIVARLIEGIAELEAEMEPLAKERGRVEGDKKQLEQEAEN